MCFSSLLLLMATILFLLHYLWGFSYFLVVVVNDTWVRGAVGQGAFTCLVNKITCCLYYLMKLFGILVGVPCLGLGFSVIVREDPNLAPHKRYESVGRSINPNPTKPASPQSRVQAITNTNRRLRDLSRTVNSGTSSAWMYMYYVCMYILACLLFRICCSRHLSDSSTHSGIFDSIRWGTILGNIQRSVKYSRLHVE